MAAKRWSAAARSRNKSKQKQNMKRTNNIIAFAAAALFAASPVIAHEGHEHGEKDELASGGTKKISGEVLDMAATSITMRSERNTPIAQRSASPAGCRSV